MFHKEDPAKVALIQKALVLKQEKFWFLNIVLSDALELYWHL